MPLKISLFRRSDSDDARGDRWGFDRDFYLRNYPDVALSGADPRNHYSEFGWKEGRDPSEYFSTKGYLAGNPDVAASEVNPLEHFVKYGALEHREGWRKRSQADFHAELRGEIQALRNDFLKSSNPRANGQDSHSASEVSARASSLPLTPRAKTLFCRLHDLASKQ
jgi:hypothetical protein